MVGGIHTTLLEVGGILAGDGVGHVDGAGLEAHGDLGGLGNGLDLNDVHVLLLAVVLHVVLGPVVLVDGQGHAHAAGPLGDHIGTGAHGGGGHIVAGGFILVLVHNVHHGHDALEGAHHRGGGPLEFHPVLIQGGDGLNDGHTADLAHGADLFVAEHHVLGIDLVTLGVGDVLLQLDDVGQLIGVLPAFHQQAAELVTVGLIGAQRLVDGGGEGLGIQEGVEGRIGHGGGVDHLIGAAIAVLVIGSASLTAGLVCADIPARGGVGIAGRGGFPAAAGGQGEDHAQGQRQGQEFFHVAFHCFPPFMFGWIGEPWASRPVNGALCL